jgi:hypothetical protein
VRTAAQETAVTPQTIAGPSAYWDHYYGSEFVFGLGTEHILAALRRVPPAGTWADLGETGHQAAHLLGDIGSLF